MGVCKICGSRDASYICARCGGMVCSGCFHPERGLCSICKDLAQKERLFSTADLSSIFVKLFPMAPALISAGMFLIILASILSLQAGGESVFIFPFFVGTASGTLAVVLTIAVILISVVVMFLPWILGPRRLMRALEKIGGMREESTGMMKARGRRGVEDYLITLKMPGYEENNIDIQVFDGDLIVQAYKRGKVFERTYNLPSGFDPTGLEYKYEDDFLIIKVSLKLKENA
jgi:HSP20 family molecular chaperone IbpA